MKYLGFAMIFMGIFLLGVSEAEPWLPMFFVLVVLGGTIALAGTFVVYSTIDVESDE